MLRSVLILLVRIKKCQFITITRIYNINTHLLIFDFICWKQVLASSPSNVNELCTTISADIVTHCNSNDTILLSATNGSISESNSIVIPLNNSIDPINITSLQVSEVSSISDKTRSMRFTDRWNAKGAYGKKTFLSAQITEGRHCKKNTIHQLRYTTIYNH